MLSYPRGCKRFLPATLDAAVYALLSGAEKVFSPRPHRGTGAAWRLVPFGPAMLVLVVWESRAKALLHMVGLKLGAPEL